VTALFDALARVFLAPSPQAQPIALAAPCAAVCGPDAEPIACALALLLRARGPAVVCTWASAARRPGAPATAGARRLAASMKARDLSTVATGRLVVVRLDDDAQLAVGEAGRAAAAAGDAPVVTAICGPRDPAFDDLLAGQDVRAIAAGDAPDELLRLAAAALGDCAAAVRSLGGVSSWAARCGLLLTPAARRALAGVQVQR
jgi:hypothetical protein